MMHDLTKVFWMQGIEDVKEVLTRRSLVLRVLGREVPHELGILFEFRPKGLDRELIVVGHLDLVHGGLQHQGLLAGEHLLEEVVGHEVLVREVVLL